MKLHGLSECEKNGLHRSNLFPKSSAVAISSVLYFGSYAQEQVTGLSSMLDSFVRDLVENTKPFWRCLLDPAICRVFFRA